MSKKFSKPRGIPLEQHRAEYKRLETQITKEKEEHENHFIQLEMKDNPNINSQQFFQIKKDVSLYVEQKFKKATSNLKRKKRYINQLEQQARKRFIAEEAKRTQQLQTFFDAKDKYQGLQQQYKDNGAFQDEGIQYKGSKAIQRLAKYYRQVEELKTKLQPIAEGKIER